MIILALLIVGTGHGAVDAAIMWALGLAGASSNCPPSPCKTLFGKGASSLVGASSHLAVLFGEQPDRDEKRTRESATKPCCKGAGCCGSGGVGEVV